MAAVTLPAQTLTTLHSFDGTDGALPQVALVQGNDGDFYGITMNGGANNLGTVFKISTSGTLTTLHSFCSEGGIQCTDGGYPNGLVRGPSGDFFGTTAGGGAKGNPGTIFKITPSGTLTTLYSFCAQSGCPDGEEPVHGLVYGASGDFYGTTFHGGTKGSGTVFKVTPGGTLATLYSFCAQSGCLDGKYPVAGLAYATNGDLYGGTFHGGAQHYGTVFKITPGGMLTTLFSLCGYCTSGFFPNGLSLATKGDFYGTMLDGGANLHGTVFKITPNGTLATLYSFCPQYPCTDGEAPQAVPVQATDGDFYGTTSAGGANGPYGTVFKITSSGTLTTIYSFCAQSGCPDGDSPVVGLVQGTDGSFYGTTASGGANNDGTVFSLSVGLGPFVETLPTSGKVGAAVKIQGTNLNGATSVSFNGAGAVFEVLSSSEITTTVPSGASSGKVQVVTPIGTLSSKVPFRVLTHDGGQESVGDAFKLKLQ